jgi:hypothetical protein
MVPRMVAVRPDDPEGRGTKKGPGPGSVPGGGLCRPMSGCGARGGLRAFALRLQGEGQGHRDGARDIFL